MASFAIAFNEFGHQNSIRKVMLSSGLRIAAVYDELSKAGGMVTSCVI
jgi:hypothetical protein